MSSYWSGQVCPGHSEELLEDYPPKTQKKVGKQNVSNKMSQYAMQLSASPGFAYHDLKTGPFYHDLMMLTNMYIFPLKAFAILFSEQVLFSL